MHTYIHASSMSSASSSNHAEEIFAKTGNLSASLQVFHSEEQIHREKATSAYVPMTFAEMETKFGKETAAELAKDLEDLGQYDVMPERPKDKNTWHYRVYGGVTKKKAAEKTSTTGIHVKARVAPGENNAKLLDMMSEEHDAWSPTIDPSAGTSRMPALPAPVAQGDAGEVAAGGAAGGRGGAAGGKPGGPAGGRRGRGGGGKPPKAPPPPVPQYILDAKKAQKSTKAEINAHKKVSTRQSYTSIIYPTCVAR